MTLTLQWNASDVSVKTIRSNSNFEQRFVRAKSHLSGIMSFTKHKTRR